MPTPSLRRRAHRHGRRLLALCAALAFELASAESDVGAHGLRCEYLVNPLGVHEPQPRLSWQLPPGTLRQSAYRLRVATSPETLHRGGADVFDSGRVPSDQQAQIPYNGPPLRSGVRYYWTVETWDETGRAAKPSQVAWWQMGLLSRADWQAQWIGTGERLPANVPGLFGYRSQSAPAAESAKWVRLDLGKNRPVDRLVLHPVRPGSVPDAPVPGFLFPVRFKVEVSTDENPEEFSCVWDRTARDFPIRVWPPWIAPGPPEPSGTCACWRPGWVRNGRIRSPARSPISSCFMREYGSLRHR